MTSRLNAPEASAVVVPSEVVPSNNSTVEPTSAVPVIVTLCLLVRLSVDESPVSSVIIKSRPVGAAGAVASTVMASAADAAPTLPAASVALAVIERAPAASVTSRLNAPEAFAVVVPSEVVPSNNSTRASASACPVIVKPELWLVTLSALSVPLSSAAARSRPVGAAGAVASTVMASAADAAPTLPAASVALAVIERAPAASVTSRLNAPEAFAVVVPSEVVPSNNSTRASASACPVIVKPELWLVTLSALSVPLSSAAARSRPVGAAGAVASTVMASAADAAPTLPAASVALAVIERAPAASVTSRLNAPEAFAVVVPSEVVPSNNSTRASASACPVIVKPELWLVTLSALSVPLSSAAARSRPVGAAGAVASTVMASAADAAPTLPAASVALAVIERAPAASVTSRLNAPEAFAVVVPSEVVPSNNSTRALASA